MLSNRGMVKQKIAKAIFDTSIKDAFMGDKSKVGNMVEAYVKEFDKHVFSHIDTIGEVGAEDIMLYFDVFCPDVHSGVLQIHIYVRNTAMRCVRFPGYFGNAADNVAEMVNEGLEEAQKNNDLFGAKIDFSALEPINHEDYVGLSMTYHVSNM